MNVNSEDFEKNEVVHEILYRQLSIDGVQGDVRRDDVLGLGKINFENLTRLTSAWTVERPRRGDDHQITDSERRAVDPSRREFDSEAYLSCFHSSTPASELRRGQAILRRLIERDSQEIGSSIRENLHWLVDYLTLVGDEDANKSRSIKDARVSLDSTVTKLRERFTESLNRRKRIDNLNKLEDFVQSHSYLFDLPRRLWQGFDPKIVKDIVDDYQKAVRWIRAQDEAELTNRIAREVNRAMNDYLERQNKILQDPAVSVEELERTLVVLELLFADQDFLSRLIDSRCSVLLSQLRRIRGISAINSSRGVSKDRVLFRPVDVRLVAQDRLMFERTEDYRGYSLNRYDVVVENASVIVRLLAGSFRDGLGSCWDVASIAYSRAAFRESTSGLVTIREVFQEFFEAVTFAVFPSRLQGANLVSREVAVEIRESVHFVRKLGAEVLLTPLLALADEIVVALMVKVSNTTLRLAEELGGMYRAEPEVLSEQLVLLVKDAVDEIVGLSEGRTATAEHHFLESSLRAPVLAAAAVRKAAQEGSSTRGHLTLVAGVCKLRTVALRSIEQTLESNFPDLDCSVSGQSKRVELEAFEAQIRSRFLAVFEKKCKNLIFGGLVGVEELTCIGELPRPYAKELLLNSAVCFAQVQATEMSVSAWDICQAIVVFIASSFSEAVKSTSKPLGNAAQKQCLLEIDFVEEGLRRLLEGRKQQSSNQSPVGPADSPFAGARSLFSEGSSGTPRVELRERALASMSLVFHNAK
uniref:Exocyst complex component n=1 Tax=Rhodosorus marinus TaxID=101924 RepID=A0A7S0BMI5_9RHOD|mmetsp:Transcript_23437/g.33668  ORF Transcript_23437/g.33668 Transcript_23437/m.33668 type:complete len:755 (+) Transcript_23437:446-2710(+)